MRFKNFGNNEIPDIDWAAADRQAALRSMHRVKLRVGSAAYSGWGTDVAGRDKRSVHASLRGKVNMRLLWWKLFCRVYVAVVPSADLEQAMYSFHRMHHEMTLGWLSYVVFVGETCVALKRRGFLTAVRRAAAKRV
jgi:hypothetical protein